MRTAIAFAGVGVLAVLAGVALWLGTRQESDVQSPAPGEIGPGVLAATTFSDTNGRPHTLGEFEGKVLVVNFWATWCAPCREEMPAFSRLQERWRRHNVQFVGLANDDPAKVERFGTELGIRYPLWVGGERVSELGRRVGNRLSVLPFTILVDPSGRILEARVGPYTEGDLEDKLQRIVGKST